MHPDAATSRRPPLLALAGLGVLLLAAGLQKVWSIDVWWQLRNGQWIVEHLDVPRSEMYSWTNAGAPLREMRWLYCAALYLLYARVGDWSMTLLQAAAVWSAWAITIWPFRRMLRHPLVPWIIGLGVAAGLGRWVMRPELATYVGVALSLALLSRLRGRDEPGDGHGAPTAHVPADAFASARAHGARPRPFPYLTVGSLVLMQVLWTNLHTLFFFGPLLAWCFVAGEGVQRAIDRARGAPRRPLVSLPLLAGAVGSTLACWANPYFHDGAMYVVQMFRETRAGHATNQFIGEMRSPTEMPLADWTWDLVAGAILACVGVTIAALNIRRFDVVRLGILALGVILFIQLQRNAPMLALMAAWAALGELRSLAAARRSSPHAGSPRAPSAASVLARRASPVAFLVACLLAAWFIASDRVGPRLNQPRESGFGVVEWTLPAGGVAFLAENPPSGRLFNTIRDGAYLIWRAHSIPVFIDGRTDAYGPQLLTEVSTISGADWDAFANARAIDAAILPTVGYDDLISTMARSPQWAPVFVDHRSVVFYRRTPAHATVIAAASPGLIAPPPPETFPPDTPPAWKRGVGAPTRAWRAEGFASAWFALGRPELARAWITRGLAAEPRNLNLRAFDATARLGAADDPEGWASLRALPRERRSGVLREASRALLSAPRFDLAERVLAEAIALEPDARDLHVARGDALFQGGRPRDALPCYVKAQDLGPAHANEWNKIATIEDALGNPANAERAAEASLNLDPNQALVWSMLGTYKGRRGELRGAITCFENALKIDPAQTRAAENLARAKAYLQQAAPKATTPPTTPTAPTTPIPPPPR
ncbi:MAG: tetratricopeptide repeat protein [Planctomycetota bacterium]|nr:tetratricopeptide repeat protein [Planctomycetota bacterium]